MPPQRSILGPIAGNRAFNHQLTPYQKGLVVGMTISGAKPKFIRDHLNISHSAIRSIITFEELRNKGKLRLRSGRPVEYIEADERNLIRHVRLYPKDIYTQVKIACRLKIKQITIKKILKCHGIINWRARRQPFLTKANAVERLA